MIKGEYYCRRCLVMEFGVCRVEVSLIASTPPLLLVGVNAAYIKQESSEPSFSIAHRRPNRRMTADTQVVTSRNGMRLNLLKANIRGRMAHIRRSCPASTPRLKPIRQKARCDFGMAISASAFANPKPCISPKQKVSPHR